MADDNWQQARLIPTSGINGADEAERRATSALLAVTGSVREFGTAIVRGLGAPAGQLETFIEVPFASGERTVYPDGLLQTSRGSRTWTCLVEVKTGSAELEREQVETYLDVARENGFDCVLTVSNQIAPAQDVHPVEVDKRKLKKVGLRHLSWAEVLTIAVQQRVHRGVSDPDQAWILGELIRYLEHPKSGALDFADMGAAWVTVRESIAAGTLRANDRGLADVVARWEQLLRFAALRLGRELGANVEVQLSRRELADPSLRFTAQSQSLVGHGTLTGSLKIPAAIAPIDVVADLRSGRVTISVDVDAPREGRPATRVNWLVRQLRDAPDGLRIDAFAASARSSTSDLLRVVRDDPSVLIVDQQRDFRTFRIAATSPLGAKRGTGRGGFIDSVLASVDGFYGGVVQQLRPWSPKAPQLSRSSRTAVEEAGIDIVPPPLDMQEAPEESSPPPALEDGVAADALADATVLNAGSDAGDADWAAGPSASEAPTSVEINEPAADEFVSWDSAHARLEHERDLESPAPAARLAAPDPALPDPSQSRDVDAPDEPDAGVDDDHIVDDDHAASEPRSIAALHVWRPSPAPTSNSQHEH